jgi:hypothetical protein
MSSLSGGSGVSLLSEMIGFFRRSLGQQASVREALYTGLTQIVSCDPGRGGGGEGGGFRVRVSCLGHEGEGLVSCCPRKVTDTLGGEAAAQF